MNKKEFFDEIAAKGNLLLFREDELGKVARLKQRLGPLTGLKVLEPGCGAGPLTEYLCDWIGPTGHVLAFDPSANMVKCCQQRLCGRKNVEIICAFAETIELTEQAWDLVLLFRVFPHFDDKELVLRKFRASLVPGGRLVIAHFEGSERLNARHAGFSEPVRHDRMPVLPALCQLLHKIGFTVSVAIDTNDELFVDATVTVEE